MANKTYTKNKKVFLSQTKNKDNFFCKPSQEGNSSNSTNNFFTSPITPSSPASNKEKKPFDKKKWRLQKYSMKHKVQNWEERRKKAILRDYYKQNKKTDNSKKLDVNKIYEEHDADSDDNEEQESETNINRSKKKDSEEYLDVNEQKKQKREEFLRRKREKEELLQKYKKEKTERYKRLNKKTKRGQPVMKARLEDLLERIQKSVGRNDND